jgi:hypothetical protein
MHIPRLSNRKAMIEAVKHETGAIFMGFEEKIKGWECNRWSWLINSESTYIQTHANTHTLPGKSK